MVCSDEEHSLDPIVVERVGAQNGRGCRKVGFVVPLRSNALKNFSPPSRIFDGGQKFFILDTASPNVAGGDGRPCGRHNIHRFRKTFIVS
jgi:hypothetical protein